LALFITFECTFAIGGPIQDWLQMGIDALYELIITYMPAGWFTSLLGDGVVLGVGTLLTALPNIIILFFFLSLMEDSGYMSRIAYLMDGLMHIVGLHGRSFIPLLMGFDCNVPAIMAAKDIMDKKDRTLTMLMVPFMSCSARLPVYILFISLFFESHKGLVLLSLYLIGIVMSFGFAFLLKRTPWFRKPIDPKVNELPDFKLPTWGSIARHIWYRVSDFLKKISTVVLCASVIIWALEFFPAQDLQHLETSWLATIGRFLEPIMAPLGFDWKMSVCLLTGVPAKEAIAATFAILFSGDTASVALTPVSAYAFLIFTLLYFPCVATVSTLRRETSWQWATVSVINSLIIAWLGAFAAYHIGMWIVG
jgi:ferrous iron transport protein B